MRARNEREAKREELEESVRLRLRLASDARFTCDFARKGPGKGRPRRGKAREFPALALGDNSTGTERSSGLIDVHQNSSPEGEGDGRAG